VAVSPAPVAVSPAPARAGPQSKIVTVRPGNSLWTITAAQLRAAHSRANVSMACARVYALNRAAIGPDPDLIQPGQSLDIPADL
ncbi:MAG: LysM peptidoglycan-binding domain-containing protein, partial [Actinomycetota bacterium]|nr:LysM peptidoglycan-binding domain-containing protein [Actinomycetota bacterium]